MSLILNSKPYRNALQIVLNEAYMPQHMAQKTKVIYDSQVKN
jgi:hypothetical protein